MVPSLTDEQLIEFRQIQEKIAEKIILKEDFRDLERIAGVDVAYLDDMAYAACIVMDRDFKEIGAGTASLKVDFPYIPGYLSFREAPAALAAIGESPRFDLVMVNGHGVAHPRGFGHACHVGTESDSPSIGVAKRLLVGSVGDERDGWKPIMLGGDIVGAEVVTRWNSRIYVSVGHRVSLETAIELAQSMTRGAGFPEPLKRAHALANKEANDKRARA
jgi:deoxyribonuclease V